MMLKLIAAQDHQPPADGDARAVALPNDADALALPLDGVDRVDLHFPNFTDGRAFSQAFCCAAAVALRARSAPPATC